MRGRDCPKSDIGGVICRIRYNAGHEAKPYALDSDATALELQLQCSKLSYLGRVPGELCKLEWKALGPSRTSAFLS